MSEPDADDAGAPAIADADDPRPADPGDGSGEQQGEASGEDAGEDASEPTPEVTGWARFDCTDSDRIEPAAEAARRAVEAGECVVLPTDTVYGIGADAFDAKAVQRLLDAKGRGRDMPPPVLIADAGQVRALVDEVPEAAEQLTAAFWPGALTVILRAHPSLRMDLGETHGTVALRVPDHELARSLLRRTGPMAVSSANASGSPAALDCDEAIGMLGDRVSVYLDGGRLGDEGRPPSTMVDFTQLVTGQVLRLGALSLEQLREVCPDVVGLPEPELAPPAARPDRARFTLQPPARTATSTDPAQTDDSAQTDAAETDAAQTDAEPQTAAGTPAPEATAGA